MSSGRKTRYFHQSSGESFVFPEGTADDVAEACGVTFALAFLFPFALPRVFVLAFELAFRFPVTLLLPFLLLFPVTLLLPLTFLFTLARVLPFRLPSRLSFGRLLF